MERASEFDMQWSGFTQSLKDYRKCCNARTDFGSQTLVPNLDMGESQVMPISASAFHVKFSPLERLVAYCGGDGVIWVTKSSGEKPYAILKSVLPDPINNFYWIRSFN